MKSIKCTKCDRPALIHITEVDYDTDSENKTVRDVHLCLFHAADAGMIAGLPKAILANLEAEGAAVIAGITGEAPTGRKKRPSGGKQPTCPICGSTWNDFEQTGLMGCPHDVQFFEVKLLPVVKGLQEGRLQHVGKIPLRSGASGAGVRAKINRLKESLAIAVAKEQFEEAAKLRDEIKELEIRIKS